MTRTLGRGHRFLVLSVATLLALFGANCASVSSQAVSPVASPHPLLASDLSPAGETWVESTLAGLTLEEKAAQLVMVWIQGYYLNPESEALERAVELVRDLGIGGLIMSTSEVETLPRLINDMQRQADVPLIIAADVERGMSFRVRRSTLGGRDHGSRGPSSRYSLGLRSGCGRQQQSGEPDHQYTLVWRGARAGRRHGGSVYRGRSRTRHVDDGQAFPWSRGHLD